MNEHEKRIIFSSERSTYCTPPELFNPLNEIFKFQLDAAADEANTLCEEFYDEEMDSLSQDWDRASVWCNPPYGREKKDKPGTLSWVRWAHYQVYDKKVCGLVAMLIPAKTETEYFQDYCFRGAGILWLRGRVKFIGMPNGAPFPSAIVFFSRASLNIQFGQYSNKYLETGVLHDYQTPTIFYNGAEDE